MREKQQPLTQFSPFSTFVSQFAQQPFKLPGVKTESFFLFQVETQKTACKIARCKPETPEMHFALHLASANDVSFAFLPSSYRKQKTFSLVNISWTPCFRKDP